ncbi:ETX/MTX2 family pore-forming toxin [Bacillus paramycoides]|uniref:ETX/MTX2 family pore-forming toxin n=1 Tax=Bacillus paramycoides TaxID=2026194 RepID=UPI00381B000A
MKKSNKKTKQILSLAMIGAIGTSFALTSPTSASAAQVNPVQTMAQAQGSVSVSDWKDPFKKAFSVLQENNASFGIDSYSRSYYKDQILRDVALWNVYQSSVEADGSPTITNSNSLFVGKTTLNNNSDQEQVLSTNEFSKAFENSVSSSVTNGFNLGVTASSTFGIPLIGETSVQLSTEYNFSKTDTNTKAETYTYTAPSQNIKVPAHSSVEVIVNLNTAKISGNVKLLSLVDGYATIDYNGGTGDASLMGIASQALQYDKNLGLMVDNKAFNENKVYLVGSGNYSAEYGTEFTVSVRPVEKPSTFAAKSRSMVAENSKATNESYTYKVKPEVKKEQ